MTFSLHAEHFFQALVVFVLCYYLINCSTTLKASKLTGQPSYLKNKEQKTDN